MAIVLFDGNMAEEAYGGALFKNEMKCGCG